MVHSKEVVIRSKKPRIQFVKCSMYVYMPIHDISIATQSTTQQADNTLVLP